MIEPGAPYILCAPGFGFQASKLSVDGTWHVIIGDHTVGFLQEENIEDWTGVDLFVRAAALQLYGLQL